MTSTVTYTGDLRTVCHHMRSGNEFITDAPVDNHGLGQAFSPTDTVATALASCMLTVMGIKARDKGIELEGSKAEITKHMAANPRRISRIEMLVYMPAAVGAKERKMLEHTARTCPVMMSINPAIETDIEFRWEL